MFAVVMAGGSGTRFWPASREHLPKQFLSITSERTLFEETIDRIRPIMSDENIYVVVNRVHEATTRKLRGERKAHILTEPIGRNTAACVGLAALHVRQKDENDSIVVLPSDHFIADAPRFMQALSAAAELARGGAIVMLGIPPTRPETGYGYIEVAGESGRVQGEPYLQVERFVEKPDRATALHYLAGGRHFWNAGIFIFTAKTILAEIERCMPALHEGLKAIDAAIGRDHYEAAVEKIYTGLESVSIDYGIMEKTRVPMYVLRGDFGWSDIGSWQALYELRNEHYDTDGNLLPEQTVTIDARRNLVYGDNRRMVALLGVEGLIVVDTPDALMVADMNRSQDVKKLTELLKSKGRKELC